MSEERAKTEAEIDREKRERQVDLGLRTLAGDFRDTILTHIRAMPVVWRKLGEVKQQEKIDAIEKLADDMVRRGTALIARNGFDAVPVMLGKFGVNGREVKGQFEAVFSESNIIALADHQGANALIVLADHTEFFGERETATPDPDEPQMPLDEAARDADEAVSR